LGERTGVHHDDAVGPLGQGGKLGRTRRRLLKEKGVPGRQGVVDDNAGGLARGSGGAGQGGQAAQGVAIGALVRGQDQSAGGGEHAGGLAK
jgi:hypothetical protein